MGDDRRRIALVYSLAPCSVELAAFWIVSQPVIGFGSPRIDHQAPVRANWPVADCLGDHQAVAVPI